MSDDKKLWLLLKAYTRLNELNASPGDKAHMLAYSIKFIEREIKALLKGAAK